MQDLDKLNTKIKALWEEYFQDDETTLFPYFYPELKRNILLFIGCNPAFNKRRFHNIFKDTEYEGLNYENFYLWKNRSEDSIIRAGEIEKIAKLKHSYFNKFPEISDYVGLDWEHIDLFLVRETCQENLKEQVLTNNKLNEFGRKQLEIALELISMIEPKVIVVSNAFVSNILQAELDIVFDETLGCHFIDLKNKAYPVFFTSMLTGQRALDKGSMMRLKWHIKRVL